MVKVQKVVIAVIVLFSAFVVCRNTVDPNQSAPTGVVRSGSTLFASMLTFMLVKMCNRRHFRVHFLRAL